MNELRMRWWWVSFGWCSEQTFPRGFASAANERAENEAAERGEKETKA